MIPHALFSGNGNTDNPEEKLMHLREQGLHD